MPDGCPIEEVVLNLEPQVDEVEIGAAGPGGPTHWSAIADKPDFDALYDPAGAASAAQAAAAIDATEKAGSAQAAAAADATAKANAAQTAAVDTLRAGVAADGDTLAKLRALIQGIQTLLTSDRLDLDTLQEVVDFVEVHQSSLESLGTGKVNVSDIINVLTDASTAKPLSAAQGKVLKDLIDALVVVVSGKEPAILSDTSDKYLRGDKTWADFAANVRMTVLTGLSTASASVISATDSVLSAIGKIQAQISDVITQTEAETGTSTTRRSWTAQRVRQATAAWWLTASSALGRTLASIADAAAGRTALGLGSASVLASGQADPNLPTNSDLRAYYGVKYKPSIAPTLVIDFESSYFAIYSAPTNSLFVADNWDAFATYLGADLVITRAGGQTYFDALGVMRTAAAATVQCDHDPLTGQRLGPYFGPARTNILLNSEAPATQSVIVTAQAYALSFYGTGSVSLSGAHTATLVGSGAFPVRSTLTFTPTAGTLTLTVSGTVQKFQLEAGSEASPYILTTGAAATRPVSHMRIVGNKFTNMHHPGSGTVVVDAQANSTASCYVSISDGTNTERIVVATGAGSGGNVTAVVVTGSVRQAEPQVNTAAAARHRIGMSYTKDAVYLSVDGSAPATDTSASIPTAVTMFIVGAYSNLGGSLGGNVRYVALYPSAINAQEISK